MVVIPPFGGGCAGRCAQTADHLGEKRRKWGVVGEVDSALSRWVLTWRVRGRGPNVNVVSKPPTYAPRLRGRGPNANVVSKLPTYVPCLVGGITTIEGFCRRVAGVSGVYGRKTPRAVARKGQGRVPVEGSMVLNLPCGCLKCSRPRWYAGDMGCLGCSGLRFGRGGWVDGGVMARLCAGGPFRWRCGRRQWPGATRMGLRRSMRLTSPPRAAPERDGVRSSRASSSPSISHV